MLATPPSPQTHTHTVCIREKKEISTDKLQDYS